MNVRLNPPRSSLQDALLERSPSALVSEGVQQGLDKIFDVHWDCTDFMSAFANGEYKSLNTLQLLNEMITNWIDAKPKTLNRLTANERAAMDLASSAWKPFFEFALMLEEQT